MERVFHREIQARWTYRKSKSELPQFPCPSFPMPGALYITVAYAFRRMTKCFIFFRKTSTQKNLTRFPDLKQSMNVSNICIDEYQLSSNLWVRDFHFK